MPSVSLSQLITFGALAYHVASGSCQSSRPTATVTNGSVVGVELPTFNQDFFGGIPYAQPPVGDLRLRHPLSINASFTNGSFDASDYSPICPGHGSDDVGYTLGEDCLTINVVRPSNVSAGADLPVMLWIHGGGYFMGSSRDTRYNQSYIVNRSVEMGTPVIGVSINYRVSHFGFLSSRQIHLNGLDNLGLWDQRLALHWVQENIAAFGGDPSKVTVWGESAGAMSISMHLIAFGGVQDPPLFRAAIMESGNPTVQMTYTPDLYQPFFDNLTAAVNCSEAQDILACLRAVPYDDFFAAGGNVSTAVSTWQPVIDSVFVPGFPSQQLKEGKYFNVPILNGANTDEGYSFGPGGINTEDDLIDALYASTLGFARNSTLRTLSSLYSSDPADGVPYGSGDLPSLKNGTLDKKADSIYGDLTMIGTRRNLVEIYSNTTTAWSYRFDHVPEYATIQEGVGHFVETPFVFNNPLPAGEAPTGTENPRGNSTDDLYLGLTMQSQWISFAVHLDPNFHGVDGVPYWPDYSNGTQNILYRNSTEGGTTLEVDNWRQAGIAFINEWSMDFGR
ncbi:alpha/beta-hydrolase [Stereum hirsutum FP-91666 SS1]|uniref:alpha/beta-hydrolase n=1 Tax=Stereum hirsutum (strain FP-91666) TaxID=721885 RepID=UPI000444A654|nr:alpha/beta-hydrolase [Stereum hirsutum FP-91666 SS1]EIM84589.1 alpha/beta-hydrolase [Stereum hirsutum FP-91666 SS1]